jgi:carboxypeptidase D
LFSRRFLNIECSFLV